MSRRPTWWHLEGQSQRPNDYDVATTRLLWYPTRGLAVATPVAEWIQLYQRGSRLVARDWDAFRDPRQTTYAKYTELQRDRETFVDGLFGLAEENDDDDRLAPRWIALLDRVLAPLRFPVHGLQMTTAYVGAMAPGGRIVVASLLQAADEVRRIQRIAYRVRLLQLEHPGFAADSRAVWERDALWQPMRRLVEQLLVTYDWGEAFVALTDIVKPAFDELFTTRFAAIAGAASDVTLVGMLRSLHEDQKWHRAWSGALSAMLCSEDDRNKAAIAEWRERWQPRVDAAIAPFAGLFEDAGDIAARAGGPR
jgi:toluene monooxygenase system protein E